MYFMHRLLIFQVYTSKETLSTRRINSVVIFEGLLELSCQQTTFNKFVREI